MSYSPSTAAQAAAALAGSNQASLATPLTALQSSIAGGNLAPAALFDAIIALGAGQDTALIDTVGSGTTFTTTAVTLASATYTAPMTRTYEFSVDIAGMENSAANYSMLFTILVDGTTVYSVNAGKIVGNDTVRHNASWRQRIPLTAGSHSIAIRASVNVGTGTFDSTTGLTVYVR
jgi:hypothetical protein